MQTPFEVTVPIIKAERVRSNGGGSKLWIHGVASDESPDTKGEVTPTAGLANSLPYLQKFGKFVDGESPDAVGEILVASCLTNAELVKRGVLAADQVPKSQADQKVLYVAGPLYAKGDRAKYYRDILESGGRLGLQIRGAVLEQEVTMQNGRSLVVNRACFVHKIAITDSPANLSTWCSLKKSFSYGLPAILASAVKQAALTDEVRIESTLPQPEVTTMSYDEKMTLLQLAARHGMVRASEVAKFELAPQSLTDQYFETLHAQMLREKKITKALPSATADMADVGRKEALRLLSRGHSLGLVGHLAVAELEIGGPMPTQSVLKSLRIEIDAANAARKGR